MRRLLEYAFHSPQPMKSADLSTQFTHEGGLQSLHPPAESQNAVWPYLSLPILEGADMDLT